jgi:hypothetical protein
MEEVESKSVLTPRRNAEVFLSLQQYLPFQVADGESFWQRP